MSIKHKLENAWYAVYRVAHNTYWALQHRFNPRHRYHVVRTGLKPGYYDKDVLLLHASFNLLKDFVEREKPFDWFDTEHSHRKAQWDEIWALYTWWTVERPKRHEQIPPEPDSALPGWLTNCPVRDQWVRACNEIENRHEIEDDEMLARLARVRRCLWT